MSAAHLDVDRLAEATRVDPKTVHRWLAGRVPQTRLRWNVAKALGEDESYLWPSVGARTAAGSTAEIIAAFPHRIDFPIAAWSEILRTARKSIDLIGYALLFLPEQQRNLIEELAAKAGKGCAIRICLALPTCAAVKQRDEEEGLHGALAARVQTGWTYFGKLLGTAGIEFRAHDVPMYNSVFRFDGQMLVTPHLYSFPGYQSPMIQLRRMGNGGIFDTFMEHFDAIWRIARPISVLDDLSDTERTELR
jgi:hypothetical protein